MRAAARQVADSLRDEILSGALPGGTRLGEADLAERLEVSRTPVREALSLLAAEGIVEREPNRGARVASWSTEELGEIFAVRLVLEPHAVRLAVPRLSDDDLDELTDLAVRMRRLGRPGKGRDLLAVFELNRAFHARLVEAAANPMLAAALRTVTHAAVVLQNFHDYSPDALHRSLAHHVEIVAAARARDADWAEAVMRSHLLNARATMIGGTP